MMLDKVFIYHLNQKKYFGQKSPLDLERLTPHYVMRQHKNTKIDFFLGFVGFYCQGWSDDHSNMFYLLCNKKHILINIYIHMIILENDWKQTIHFIILTVKIDDFKNFKEGRSLGWYLNYNHTEHRAWIVCFYFICIHIDHVYDFFHFNGIYLKLKLWYYLLINLYFVFVGISHKSKNGLTISHKSYKHPSRLVNK